MSGALFKTTILEVESFSDAAREAKGSMHPRSSCGSCASPVSLADRSPAPALRWLLSPRQGQSSPSTPGSCLCPASCAPGGPLPHGTSSRLSRARSISAREIQLDLLTPTHHRATVCCVGVWVCACMWWQTVVVVAYAHIIIISMCKKCFVPSS